MIPMGSDPTPFLANLFLYYYGSRWVKDFQSEGLTKTRNVMFFALLMTWMQSIMLENMKVTSQIYTQKN